MWKRQIVPYFDIHETKMLGTFKMNGHSFGEKKNFDAINKKKISIIFLKINSI